MAINSTEIRTVHALIIPSWYVNSYKPLSGIYFKEQAEALANMDLRVGVLSVQTISLKDALRHLIFDFNLTVSTVNKVNTCSIQIPSLPRFKSIKNLITLFFAKLLFHLYRRKYGLPDIVHLHSYDHGNIAVWLKRKYNISYIVSEHSSAFFRNLLPKRELDRAAHIFSESSRNYSVSSKFSNHLNLLFNKNFGILPNFVDTLFFIPGQHKAGNFQFLSIGFLENNKNHRMLIESFCSAFKHVDEVKLVIAGDGSLFLELSELIKYHNMVGRIILHGMASRDDVLKLMQLSHCLVLPSIFETFGVVVIEAMSCGMPVISTRCGGPEDIIISDSHGLLCDISKESLSSAMLKVMTHYEKYEPSSIRGYIEKNFSTASVAKEIEKAYFETIKSTKYQGPEDNR